MEPKIYYDKDIESKPLEGRTVAVLGYGSQGHAHALNLRDSGVEVVVGLYDGSGSKAKAEREGLKVLSNAEAVAASDLVAVLIPDTRQAEVYANEIAPNLKPGQTLLFSHGFTIHYQQIAPPPGVNVTMIAPKGPGHRVRELYQRGLGVPCLVAVGADASGDAQSIALAYGKAIGGARAGILETTFREETETDLFGEQTVLCGGLIELIKASYEVLVEAGYRPESAYFEVLHELKLIVDLIYQGGLKKMLWSISDTAEYGAYKQGPAVMGHDLKERLRKVLGEIQSGEFARDWISENNEGLHRFKRMREENSRHEVEEVGEQLRAMMPWLESTT